MPGESVLGGEDKLSPVGQERKGAPGESPVSANR